MLKEKNINYFVFGHRHLPIDYRLANSRYINLGDWIRYFTYGVFDGSRFELRSYLGQDDKIIRK
jgi:UDP-2,3-diacylglucosamine hydrolase